MTVTVIAAGIGLWLLATIDAAASGYRDAAGRSLKIDKRVGYRRAVRRAVAVGQGLIALAFTAGGLFLRMANPEDSPRLLEAYTGAAVAALSFFGPIAVAVGIAILLRFSRNLDVRSLTSVLVFGPFLLTRPFLAYLGVAIATASVAPPVRIPVAGLSAFAVTLMLLLEPALGWVRRWRVPSPSP